MNKLVRKIIIVLLTISLSGCLTTYYFDYYHTSTSGMTGKTTDETFRILTYKYIDEGNMINLLIVSGDIIDEILKNKKERYYYKYFSLLQRIWKVTKNEELRNSIRTLTPLLIDKWNGSFASHDGNSGSTLFKAEDIYRGIKDTEGLKKLAEIYFASDDFKLYDLKLYDNTERIYRELKDTEGLKKLAKRGCNSVTIYRELKDNEGLKNVALDCLSYGKTDYTELGTDILYELNDLDSFVQAGKFDEKYYALVINRLLKDNSKHEEIATTNKDILSAAYTKEKYLETKFEIAYLMQDELKMLSSSDKAKESDKPFPSLLLGLYMNDKEVVKESINSSIEKIEEIHYSNIKAYYYTALIKGAELLESTNIWSALGVAAYNKKNYSLSMRAFYNINSINNLNIVQREFYKEDSADLKVALESLGYDSDQVYNILGSLATEAGDYPTAYGYYVKAHNKGALTYAADKLFDSKDYDLASEYYLKSGLSKNETYLKMGQNFIAIDNMQYAKIYLKKSGKNSDEINREIGDYLYSDGKIEKALTYYEKLEDQELAKSAKFNIVKTKNILADYNNFKAEYPSYKGAKIDSYIKEINSIIKESRDIIIRAEKIFSSGDTLKAHGILQERNKVSQTLIMKFPDSADSAKEVEELMSQYWRTTDEYKAEVKRSQERYAASEKILTQLKENVSFVEKYTLKSNLIRAFGQPSNQSASTWEWTYPYGHTLKIMFDGTKIAVIYIDGSFYTSFY